MTKARSVDRAFVFLGIEEGKVGDAVIGKAGRHAACKAAPLALERVKGKSDENAPYALCPRYLVLDLAPPLSSFQAAQRPASQVT
jgi:hypothetical protein